MRHGQSKRLAGHSLSRNDNETTVCLSYIQSSIVRKRPRQEDTPANRVRPWVRSVCANLTSLLTSPEPSLRTLSVIEIGFLMSAITAEGQNTNNKTCWGNTDTARCCQCLASILDGPKAVERAKNARFHTTGLRHAFYFVFFTTHRG